MISIEGGTHPGRVRENNEDAIFMDETRGIAVVADGMGGHASGEVASRIIVETFAGESRNSLSEILLLAHRNITEYARMNPACAGMGATVVAARAAATHYQLCWVGDSRAYHFRPGQGIRQITRDHSYLELLLSQGQLSEREARKHPQRNVVTQAIGVSEPEPEMRESDWREGDLLLLCSDGLSDELTDGEIEVLLAAKTALESTSSSLIHAALEKAGRDNVSVILMENNFSAPRKSAWWKTLGALFRRS